MNGASFTIRIYSFYLFLIGAGMIIVPNLLLKFLGFAETHEIWIRMLGLFTFTAGIYYLYSSAYEQNAFYKATVIGRMFFFFMTVVFVFIFKQSPMLALIGSIDLIGSLWTYITLNHNKK